MDLLRQYERLWYDTPVSIESIALINRHVLLAWEDHQVQSVYPHQATWPSVSTMWSSCPVLFCPPELYRPHLIACSTDRWYDHVLDGPKHGRYQDHAPAKLSTASSQWRHCRVQMSTYVSSQSLLAS